MKKSKIRVKDWIEIQNEFESMVAMSCVPSTIRMVSSNHVFDENQSVKWNREQVTINNARYREEVARLNTEKNKCRDAICEDIYRAIQSEIGHDLSREKAIAIWQYAYEHGHSYGFQEIMSYLREIMELAEKLLEG